jgi:hypothetical protein
MAQRDTIDPNAIAHCSRCNFDKEALRLPKAIAERNYIGFKEIQLRWKSDCATIAVRLQCDCVLIAMRLRRLNKYDSAAIA